MKYKRYAGGHGELPLDRDPAAGGRWYGGETPRGSGSKKTAKPKPKPKHLCQQGRCEKIPPKGEKYCDRCRKKLGKRPLTCQFKECTNKPTTDGYCKRHQAPPHLRLDKRPASTRRRSRTPKLFAQQKATSNQKRTRDEPKASKGQRRTIELLTGTYPRDIPNFTREQANDLVQKLKAGQSVEVSNVEGETVRFVPRANP